MLKKVVLKNLPNNNSKNRKRQMVPSLVHQCWNTNFGSIIMIVIIVMTTIVNSAPHDVGGGGGGDDNTMTLKLNHADWPPMKHHDIWSDDDKGEFNSVMSNPDETGENDEVNFDNFETNQNLLYSAEDILKTFPRDYDFHFNTTTNTNFFKTSRRQDKVIHLFPVPVDGECLSDDGRRTGTCFNAYECRNKGGQAKGECALGFGVCCIFIANCNETVSNNITYLVSPSFPSFMPNNVTNCNLKIKLMNDDISQLRVDFHHFILGQPNRRTGVCDGDVFQVSGGPGGTFSLCGQNSGQHMYYDVGGRMLPRQTLYGSIRPLRYDELYPGRNGTNDSTMEINVNLNFAPRYLPSRLWEIRIAQIPFSQRAPAGCLQYFTGTEGIFQTFNFADNGRHLANQNYRICMRQEVEMCSIVYQPCDEQSFRIGPSSTSIGMMNMQFGSGINGGGAMGGGIMGGGTTGGGGGIMNLGGGIPQMDVINNNNPLMDQMQVLDDDVGAPQMGMSTTFTPTTITMASSSAIPTTEATTSAAPTAATTVSTMAAPITSEASPSSSAAAPAADDPAESSMPPVSSTMAVPATSTTVAPSSTPLSDDVEGSGGDDADGNTRFRPTRRPRPTRGGFDIMGFLRSALDFGFRNGRQRKVLSERHRRQFYSNCRDRITMPCIVEDFIGTGLGPLPGCEPVHCGMQFCSNGIWPCRIESTVTPFYVGIHFGDGSGKGSAEDNIGACLRYQQVQCM